MIYNSRREESLVHECSPASHNSSREDKILRSVAILYSCIIYHLSHKSPQKTNSTYVTSVTIRESLKLPLQVFHYKP